MKYGRIILGITVIATLVITFGVCSLAKEYSDLQNLYSDYKTAISSLSDKEVINGYEDGTFKPANLITRAEISKLIVKAFDLKNDGDITAEFSDVSGTWAESFINTCVANGLLKGYEDGSFRPSNNITYGEFATIICRVLNFKLGEARSDENWSEIYLRTVNDAGLTKGVATNDFIAINNARRDNVALILYYAVNHKSQDTKQVEDITEREPIKETTPVEPKPTPEIKVEDKKETSDETTIPFTDGNKMYSARIEGFKTVRGEKYVTFNAFEDGMVDLKVVKDVNYDDDYLVFFKLNTFKDGISVKKSLSPKGAVNALTVDDVDEDDVVSFKETKDVLDLNEDTFILGSTTFKLNKLTFFYVEAKQASNGDYKYLSCQETAREDVAINKDNLVIFDQNARICIIIEII